MNMGILIFLRTNKKISYFRRYLLKLINSPTSDKLLLCSGYIWEYSNYSILNDELLNAISSQNVEVITVAGMLSGQGNWENKYKSFVKRLKSNNIKVVSYKAKKKNWHAKVAIKLNGEDPIAGLIGSSNLTAPAYRENHGRFNYEADVLIWDPRYDWYFRVDIGDFIDNPLGPIDTILNPDIRQFDECERLKAIYNTTMNEEGLELFEI